MDLWLFPCWLAAGLAWSLAVTSSRDVASGFFRTGLWVVLGLVVLSSVATWESASATSRLGWVALALVAYLGAVAWHLERAAAGRAFVRAVSLLFLVAVVAAPVTPYASRLHAVGDAISGAFLLGSSLAAMLLGHHYLTQPTMSLRPLRRLTAGILLAACLRALSLSMASSAGELAGPASGPMDLFLRWGIGIAGPLILAAMTLQTLRWRATQAATGLLYVLVVFTFVGEATHLVCR